MPTYAQSFLTIKILYDIAKSSKLLKCNENKIYIIYKIFIKIMFNNEL